MRTGLFIGLVLVSGVVAGLVQSGVGLVLVEPHLDVAIQEEGNWLVADGAEDAASFWAGYEEYRAWQKGGLVISTVILGTSVGSLFGIVYAASRSSLPGENDVKKALILSGVMWAVLFLIPFLKYPAMLPGSADSDTVGERAALQLTLTAVSGLSALAFYLLSMRLGGARKIVAIAGYVALVAVLFIAMPAVPSADGQGAFQAASALGVSSFWAAVALSLGILWHRFRPDLHMREAPR